ncbi:YhcN/YlaJ family sporulation lipoprotein [Brevibacillus migulae]|uniref:YhcN/YlaJ family sporulation lipoprotein n=1 Tax=Brevibacillus migulae TaxID=1644114 RepID=UPI00196BB131|nr:YhcN/YlaJ family sporulation lipoprotein [Brevibacillus migulae]
MKKLVYPLSLLMIVAAMTACGNNNAADNNGAMNRGAQTQSANDQAHRLNGYQAPTYTRGNYSNTGTLGTRYGNNAGYGTTANNYAGTQGYNRVLADRLATAADQVPGVESATAIVYGNDAVIGVNTRFATLNDTRQRSVVEQQVLSQTRSIAPRMNIRVTSDPSMMTRIRNLDTTFRGNAGTTYGTTTGNGYGYNGTGTGYRPGTGITGGNGTLTDTNRTFTGGPATVPGNLSNAANDFGALVRDLGRTVTAPFR